MRSSIRSIKKDGFGIFEGVFEGPELDTLVQCLGHAELPRSRAGARHALQVPAVATLARDARLMQIARGEAGPCAVPFRATLFDKSPAANWLVAWHQDTALPLRRRRAVPGWGPWSIKSGVEYAHAPSAALDGVIALRVHLDDSTENNGPLRVLPGSHSRGVLTDDEVQRLAREIEPLNCLVPRGGVLAMRPLLIHSSSKSHDDLPRRVLHIEYAASMQQEHGLELAVA